MKHILITGFEPFSDDAVNVSMVTANRLARFANDMCYVSVREMPTVFGESIDHLKRAIDETNPDVIICLGQANGARDVAVERVALNAINTRIPDNRGRQPTGEATVNGGRAAYRSTLPVKDIVRVLRENGIPARVSKSAGTFVCNHMFYGLMDELARRNRQRKERWIIGGFIHLPRLPGQVRERGHEASLDIDTAVKAVQLAMETAVSKLDD